MEAVIDTIEEIDLATMQDELTPEQRAYWLESIERDMRNMLVHYRNHPSIVMWSVGNEVPTQCSADGYKVASRLQQMCMQIAI